MIKSKLSPKPDKSLTGKKNYSPLSIVNMNSELLDFILVS